VAERTFLTDDELDELVAALPSPESMPVATVDQMQAATRDLAGRAPSMALSAISKGGWAYLGPSPQDPDVSRQLNRARLRMAMAAFSAGVRHLCGHTRQIRPLLLICDPPSLVCMDLACLTAARDDCEAASFRWDNHCDSCGTHTETVTPHLSALGPLTISAHLCRACVAAVEAATFHAADTLQIVSRKSPCPCGSGRRYKHCHGKTREAA